MVLLKPNFGKSASQVRDGVRCRCVMAASTATMTRLTKPQGFERGNGVLRRGRWLSCRPSAPVRVMNRRLMTKQLPFTEVSLARAIRGVKRAGHFVVGVKGDGTLLIGDKPLDLASLVPTVEQPSEPPARRFGERL